jgi:cobalt-zinc-cadmium efflux system membrane fusion protein
VELKSFASTDPGLAARQYPAVPRGAIVERNGKKLILVRLSPERFVAREATLGWTAGDWVAVERGANPGEKVVIQGAAFLRNGGATPR